VRLLLWLTTRLLQQSILIVVATLIILCSSKIHQSGCAVHGPIDGNVLRCHQLRHFVCVPTCPWMYNYYCTGGLGLFPRIWKKVCEEMIRLLITLMQVVWWWELIWYPSSHFVWVGNFVWVGDYRSWTWAVNLPALNMQTPGPRISDWDTIFNFVSSDLYDCTGDPFPSDSESSTLHVCLFRWDRFDLLNIWFEVFRWGVAHWQNRDSRFNLYSLPSWCQPFTIVFWHSSAQSRFGIILCKFTKAPGYFSQWF
jgi:hypothetical protein